MQRTSQKSLLWLACPKAPPTKLYVLTKRTSLFKVAAPELVRLICCKSAAKSDSVASEHGRIPGSFEWPHTFCSSLRLHPAIWRWHRAVKLGLMKLVHSKQPISVLQGRNAYSLILAIFRHMCLFNSPSTEVAFSYTNIPFFQGHLSIGCLSNLGMLDFLSYLGM